MNIRAAVQIVIIVCLVSVAVWHEVWSIQESKKIYKGVIIEKALSSGRSTTHYFYVDWGPSAETIIVHPITYKLKDIGDEVKAKYSYTPILGLGGSAYAPSLDVPITIRFMGFLSKIIIIFGVFWFLLVREL